MERWHVLDATALELIEFPGKLGKEGKRPRFRFPRTSSGSRPICLRSTLPFPRPAKIRLGCTGRSSAHPFSRRTPIEHMVAHGMGGMADVLQVLNRAAMQAALTKAARPPGLAGVV
jgi:hypothetical protein